MTMESQIEPENESSFGPNFKILPSTNQVNGLHTLIRDKNTSRGDFKFGADRLIRMVIEEGLNQLPYSEEEVITPTDAVFKGIKFEKGNCGVSIVRSGEAMEKALQDCCRSMRIGMSKLIFFILYMLFELFVYLLIGKILVDHDRVIFAKFPSDIADRKVLLLYPIMKTGTKVSRSLRVLIDDSNVPQEHVILINLFCTPVAAQRVTSEFPKLKILTSELHSVVPDHFGQKYFGTENTF
uniref:Uracil phosphoribosyltransferase homolog [Nasonia vitripennis] n=1 Tax=Lepeophtheirus salmonis TaxID=72036 RepID=A0A0K2V9V1_LEPSM